MKIKDSIIKKVNKELLEIKVDIDIELCKKYGIKYHDEEEIDINKIDLFNSKSNKAAFDFLTKNC